MKTVTVDGNTATALSAYACNEIAIIYPITPSTGMAELCDQWSGEEKPTIFGTPMRVTQMQSEAGAAGALHGSLLSGALTTTFTASQGLLLMLPNMYKIAGELLPCVFHVSARSIATHALSIFGDHSDVMACRQTGFAMLCSNTVQEAHDFATISMMSTLNSSVPFLHFFDGFRTSHEINKIHVLETEELARLIPQNKVQEFRTRCLSPTHPHQQGTAQNPDVFFQNREASNLTYQKVLGHVQNAMKEFGKMTGRNYAAYEYFGSPNAEEVVVMMGSGCETMQSVIEPLLAKGKRLGLLKVRLFRPFYAREFIDALPETVKKITVLDRTKESGSAGEPLYQDVLTGVAECGRAIQVRGGRYGLGSKDFTPAMAMAVLENMHRKHQNHFTVGITDDLSFSSLEVPNFELEYDGTQCLFYGLGSDGTVSANKNTIKLIGDATPLHTQGYFVYDSKKSGSITISHLRFGKQKIQAPYEIKCADFIACHNERFIGRYQILEQLKPGGTFLLNCSWNPQQLEEKLPAALKREIFAKKINFHIIDAFEIAEKLNLHGKISTIMQSAFFKLSNIVELETAKKQMKVMAEKSYKKAGQQVVESNFKAIDMAAERVQKVSVPESWGAAQSKLPTTAAQQTSDFNENIIQPIQSMRGDALPCSAFTADGRVPTDTARFEKRGVAPEIPCWLSQNCVQCNMCSFVCPHGAIKPVLIDKKTNRPVDFKTIPAMGVENYEYRIQISPLDCTGCGSCANVCPAPQKALVMSNAEQQVAEQKTNFEFASTYHNPPALFDKNSLKGSQFAPCLFQFSGACAGCGETPYIKLATSLFGDSMVIANATGCSSIYGGSYPTCPYSTNKDGHGPAWANSLFEDNAEFGFGMNLANTTQSAKLKALMARALEQKSGCRAEFKQWLDTLTDFDQNKVAATDLIKAVEKELKKTTAPLRETLKEILNLREFLPQKSIWIIGGDGWAYDIGYGGMDHVLASNENVNILVLDTQVYSNTGGQSSKATPAGAVAKFAEFGKTTSRKNLAMMAMSYPNVYVAQIAMGANMMQSLTAMREACQHQGPSLIVAYSTCISQGIDMSNPMLEMRKAVQSGFWHLFRRNPKDGAVKLDSPDPTLDYFDFLKGERRFANLLSKNPEIANRLFEKSKKDNELILKKLKEMAKSGE